MSTEAAAVETPETDPVETEAPIIPAPEGEPAEAPSEGEPPAEAAKTEPEIPEEALKAAAEKYAAEKVRAANKTMAAARRAERAAETARAESEKVRADNKVYADFIGELRSAPAVALRKLGFAGLKEFVDHAISVGGEAKPETAEARIERLERERADERAAAKRTDEERVRAANVANVAAALGKEPERFDLVMTEPGQELLWESIDAYGKLHGTVPDEAVYALADEVEKSLETKFSNVRKFKAVPRDATNPGKTLAGGKAGQPAKNAGKTMANSSTSGAPAKREYSLDPEERRRQINADMAAAGEL